MFEYNEFKESVMEEVKRVLGENAVIEFTTVHKLNQVSYEGMLVKSSKEGVYPTFPIETFFAAYRSERISMDEVLRIVRNKLLTQPYEVSEFVKDLQEQSHIKSRIFMRVVNYEMNKEWLANYPHRKRLDLAIMYYIGKDEETDMFLVNITYDLMRRMELTEEELYSLAYENSSKKQPAVIKGIRETIPKLLWDMTSDMVDDENIISEVDEKMYVLTNSTKRLGAVCMFYEGVFEEFAEKVQDDLFILPSSTHEVMVLPCKDLEAEKLQEIVKEVNMTSVEQQELLGESVYCYKRDEKKLMVVV